MRSAEEVLKEYLPLALHPHMDNALLAMKQYAKEALEEAAEKVTYKQSRGGGAVIDKQSILSLINDLK